MGDNEDPSPSTPPPEVEAEGTAATPDAPVTPSSPKPESESQQKAEEVEEDEAAEATEATEASADSAVPSEAADAPVPPTKDGEDTSPAAEDSTEPEEALEPVAKATVAPPASPSTPDTAPTPPPKPAAPAPRRPKPPTRGILKPPRPPAKPTLGNRLRDMVSGVTGEVPGPSGRGSEAISAAAGTLSALSGRFGIFQRFVPKDEPPRQMPRTPPFRSVDPSAPAPLQHSNHPDRHKLPLKRATFVLPSISITYPISSQSEPWSPKVLEDREKVESRQRTLLSTASGGEYWTSIRLIKLYESACRGREERPRLGIVRALQALPATPKPRAIHLVLNNAPNAPLPPYPIEQPLTRYVAETLADLFTVEWALTDLRLERGVLESEEALKPILHALLISGTLPSLSLAGNKKIKAAGWRLVSVFLKQARSLRNLDLSETTWDRKGIEYLVQSLNSQSQGTPEGSSDGDSNAEDGVNNYCSFLPPAPLLKDTDNLPACVETLRMDNCTWRSGSFEALAQGIRTSDLKHISLRQNRIGQLNAVSLAVMIRDYPDTTSAVNSLSPLSSASPSEISLHAVRARGRPPTSTYADDGNLPPIPLVVSSAAGGVTSRVVPEGYKPPPPPQNPLVMPGGGYSAMQDSAGTTLSAPAESKPPAHELRGASLALQRSVRALEGVERIGNLVTLDLKGNEIGKGVTYIAQVLKRNRTLKVLNLSDNKIEPAGLVSLAEALKYNSTLETLDVSSNVCCGPGVDSISALRMSFTVNNSLKRLFLIDTGLTTDEAIDLAEFIPENRSLLHLDVTQNPIGTAGILALASGLKSNKIIRCLDVSIPPNDTSLAELSQSILQSCIRNTELAAASLKEGKPARAATEALWRPIKKSALVRQVKQADAARAQKEREQVVRSVQGLAREYVYRLKPEDLRPAAEDTVKGLDVWFAAGRNAAVRPNAAWEGTHMPKEDFKTLIERARALRERIADSVDPSVDADELEALLILNDRLTSQVAAAKTFVQPPRILLPSQIAFATPAAPVVTTTQTKVMPRTRRHQRSTSLEILSPNFSIGDSDAESDAEELDSSTIAAPLKRPGDAEAAPTAADACAKANDAAAERLVDRELAQGLEQSTSPVERTSRKWVEEEAEIFRKGTRLGVANDEDEPEVGAGAAAGAKPANSDELTGEQLRQEIMETDVPRQPPRQVVESEEDEDRDEDDDDNDNLATVREQVKASKAKASKGKAGNGKTK